MATQYYMSQNTFDIMAAEPDSVGTSSTSTDIIELRLGDGTTVPTQRQALNCLEIFKRWIMSNGLSGAGANLPPNRG